MNNLDIPSYNKEVYNFTNGLQVTGLALKHITMSIETLRNINTTSLSDNVLIETQFGYSPRDKKSLTYYFDVNSTLADDNLYVIKPTSVTGNGRFIATTDVINSATNATLPTLSAVAISGLYNDLNNKPDLSTYLTNSNPIVSTVNNLANVAKTGNYVDLIGLPNLSNFLLNNDSTIPRFSNVYTIVNNAIATLSNVAITGLYSSLTGVPDTTLRVGAGWGIAAGTLILPLSTVIRSPRRAGIIIEWVIDTLGGTGSVQFDIWRAPRDTIPTIANSICGNNYPTIINGVTAKSVNLTNWATAIDIDDVLYFIVNSINGFSNLQIQLRIS